MNFKRFKNDESGNVLFLILIAVALFAALSYAVTQSSRGSGRDASRETNLIASSQITQYPAAVRNNLIRMVLGGTDETTLEFNAPSEFGSLTVTNGLRDRGVFHPDGGAATYVNAQPDLMADASQGTWIFTGDYEVENLQTNSTGSADGNEIIAFLPNVSEAICETLNTEYGITVDQPTTDQDNDGVPGGRYNNTVTVPDETMIMDEGNGIGADVAATVLQDAFSGQPFGCFDSDDTAVGGPFVYYHVVYER